ncbi:replication initiator [Spongisporangium articulatum]|uniref:Replication initiator n=1 Tax=Spongisporangium articulatum TaxID=3362603 RepID=A0ABW8AHS7_9ACTN
MSRVERAKMPLAQDVVEAVAVSHGVCIRPVPMQVTDTTTGALSYVDVPCGATLASKCPSCAERARRLRVHQCREGWHLVEEPDLTPDAPNDVQQALMVERADITAARDHALSAGDELEALAHSEALTDVDAALRHAGVRGQVDPAKVQRATRSTRRRTDVPDLPKRPMEATTLGRTFLGRDGEVFRPSMFMTVTLPSYGKVNTDGTPRDADSYDYVRQVRDSFGFAGLLDRLVQNLRRVAGFEVQYFATVEPQRRLAPHAHFAIRGTIPRALVRQVVAATYRQVWWPTTGSPVHDDDNPPVWDDDLAGYVDPATGVPLTSWADALAELDHADDLADELSAPELAAQPFHVLRFGAQVDLQGLLAGTPDSERRIGYLAKYLTKAMSDAHAIDDTDPNAARQRAHLARLAAVAKVEPCGPGCANWLRYGIQPRGAHAGMTPGGCRSKAHKSEYLGYAGRRILVSRKWTGKTLADHRHDRRAWVLATLGVVADQEDDNKAPADSARPRDKTRDRYSWAPVERNTPIPPLAHRLLTAIAQRSGWRAAYEAARDGKPPPPELLSATPLNPDHGRSAIHGTEQP